MAHQLDLVATVEYTTKRPQLAIELSAADCGAAIPALTEEGIDAEDDWLLLHPAASTASHRYPVRLCSKLVELLAICQPRLLVFSGCTGEAGLIAQVQENCTIRIVSLAGKLDFGGLAATRPWWTCMR